MCGMCSPPCILSYYIPPEIVDHILNLFNVLKLLFFPFCGPITAYGTADANTLNFRQ